MAKNIVLIFLVSLAACNRDGRVPKTAVSPGSTDPVTIPAVAIASAPAAAVIPIELTYTTRERVVQFYTGEEGVREMTGKNDGEKVEKYLKTVGLGKGYAWCAAYVKYVYMQAGVKEASKITGAAASVNTLATQIYFKAKYRIPPQPGDAFTLYYAKLGRIGHTGFFAGWGNKEMGSFYTNEGNTNGGGSRDGDGVYRRIRQISGVHSINKWIKD